MRRSIGTALFVLWTACPAAAGEALRVEDCIARALAHAPMLQATAAEADAAAAHVGEARAAYLPSVLAHAEYGRARGYDEAVTNGGSSQGVVRMETTLFDAGVRRAALAAARARLRSASARSAQERADIVFAVRSAYATALAARDEIAIDEDVERALQAYVTLLSRQERIGAANESDVLRARLSVRAEAEARRAAESTLEAARADLASLTGTDLSAQALVDYTTAPPPADEASIAAAPAVLDARETAEAAAREIQGIEAERFGRATLTADAGAIGIALTDTFERRSGAQFLLGVDVPLFDGGARGLRAAAARADAQGARARLDEAVRKVRLAVAQAASEARRAQADAAAAREARGLAERSFHLMEARHLGGGNVRLLEVLDALTQVSTLRLSIVRAELSLRLAAARAADAIGETPR